MSDAAGEPGETPPNPEEISVGVASEKADVDITGDEDERILREAVFTLVAVADQTLAQAMLSDRSANVEMAITQYRQAAEELSKAASVCPDGHPDRSTISRRAGEFLGRSIYLESLKGAPVAAPIEEHIAVKMQLSLTGAPASSAEDGSSTPGDGEASAKPTWKERGASAAALCGGAALVALHAPVVAVAVAGGAAYASTRPDGAGKVARSLGDVGLKAASTATAFSEKHNVPDKVGKVVQGAKSVDEQYGITEKGAVVVGAAASAASSSWETLRELNRKHKLTKKIGKGACAIGTGAAATTSAVSGWFSQQSGSGSVPPPALP